MDIESTSQETSYPYSHELVLLISKHQVLDRSLRDLHRKIEETATLPGVNRQAVSLRLGILDSH